MNETASVPPTNTPPAGWYPDPLDGDRDRWWTGDGWSETTQARVPLTPAAVSMPAHAASAYAAPDHAAPDHTAPDHAAPSAYNAYTAPDATDATEPTYPATPAYTPMTYSRHESWHTPVNPLSDPLPGASIGQAFVRFWSRYAVFSGRASRSEYWWWALVFGLVYGAVIVAEAALGRGTLGYLAVSVLFLLWVLATVVPTYALLSRRLHDANFSAWHILWMFLPLAGGIVMLVLTTRPSDPAGRRFDAF